MNRCRQFCLTFGKVKLFSESTFVKVNYHRYLLIVAAGNDFPEDLSPYSLIIHCGACVANASLLRSRIRKALLAGVPITNYGIALAKLQGILERITTSSPAAQNCRCCVLRCC